MNFKLPILLSKAQLFRGHGIIAWVGGISFLLFCISGILHPLMSWTGPQAVEYKPPQSHFSLEHIQRMSAVLKHHSIDEVVSIKLVPGPTDVLLQITQERSQPRRYFNLHSLEELPAYDQQYAVWLARYYLGFQERAQDKFQSAVDILDITFITAFDSTYPSVNRLLPVYKVSFSDVDKTSIFIDTELGSKVSLTNTYKTRLQTLFRWLHTWHWLGENSIARFLVMIIMMSACVGMIITGTYLIFRFKRNHISLLQKSHRLLGVFLWAPLSFFVFSGFYHLIFTEISQSSPGFQSLPPFNVSALDIEHLPVLSGEMFSSISIIPYNTLYLRLNRVTLDQENTRRARFRGMQSESKPIYINALTGAIESIVEEDVARYYLKQHINSEQHIQDMTLITSFGGGYDFRNKRLPVWRGTLNDGTALFIDTATGFQIDKSSKADQLEGLSFSYLHKYNFLTPLTGRFVRDIIMVVILILTICMTLLGCWQLYRRQFKRLKSEKKT